MPIVRASGWSPSRGRRGARRTCWLVPARARRARCPTARSGSRGSSRFATRCRPVLRTRPRRSPACRAPRMPRRRRPTGPPVRRRRSPGRTSAAARHGLRSQASRPAPGLTDCEAPRRRRSRPASRRAQSTAPAGPSRPRCRTRGPSTQTASGFASGTRAAGGCPASSAIRSRGHLPRARSGSCAAT